MERSVSAGQPVGATPAEEDSFAQAARAGRQSRRAASLPAPARPNCAELMRAEQIQGNFNRIPQALAQGDVTRAVNLARNGMADARTLQDPKARQQSGIAYGLLMANTRILVAQRSVLNRLPPDQVPVPDGYEAAWHGMQAMNARALHEFCDVFEHNTADPADFMREMHEPAPPAAEPVPAVPLPAAPAPARPRSQTLLRQVVVAEGRKIDPAAEPGAETA